jgi:hypothetical protein
VQIFSKCSIRELLATVYADVVFVIDHSVIQVEAGESFSPRLVDYVVAQKAIIKNIITGLGVISGQHQFFLAHFSDDAYPATWIDQLDGKTRNKSGVLFGPADGYNQTEMLRRIDAFPERILLGCTDLKLYELIEIAGHSYSLYYPIPYFKN